MFFRLTQSIKLNNPYLAFLIPNQPRILKIQTETFTFLEEEVKSSQIKEAFNNPNSKDINEGKNVWKIAIRWISAGIWVKFLLPRATFMIERPETCQQSSRNLLLGQKG